MKTGGETGLHRVFLLFPVFLLSQGERMAVGTRRVGRTRPTRWGKGKPILNVECGMSNGEVERARGGAEEADFDRKWTRVDANAGPGGEFQPRRRQEICLFSCWIAEGPGARRAAAWRGS